MCEIPYFLFYTKYDIPVENILEIVEFEFLKKKLSILVPPIFRTEPSILAEILSS